MWGPPLTEVLCYSSLNMATQSKYAMEWLFDFYLGLAHMNLCNVPPRLYCPGQVPMGACSSSAKLWGGQLTEKVLKWSLSPWKAYPGCEVSCHGTESTCIVGSSMLCRDQPDSGEGCIMLQSRLTCSLVGKFSQRSVIACSMQILWCRGRTLQTRHGQVCVNLWHLMLWCPKCIRTIAAMWAQQTYLRII